MTAKNGISRLKRLEEKRVETKESIYITSPYQTDQEAIDWKMKKIHPKLFGLWCPVKYELVNKEKVYVPYRLFVFDYELKRGKKPDGPLDRKGQIAAIYDMYERHCLHFDLYDDLGLRRKSADSLSGRIIENSCSDSDALDDVVETVKWRYMRKIFNTVPDITLNKTVSFYREAWKLNLMSRGEEYEKFAYLDAFGMTSENISGLKVRINL